MHLKLSHGQRAAMQSRRKAACVSREWAVGPQSFEHRLGKRSECVARPFLLKRQVPAAWLANGLGMPDGTSKRPSKSSSSKPSSKRSSKVSPCRNFRLT